MSLDRSTLQSHSLPAVDTRGSLTGRLAAQDRFQASGANRTYTARRDILLKFRAGLLKHEENFLSALYADLRKDRGEAYMTEIGMVREELGLFLKKLERWMKPQRRATPMALQPAASFVIPEALGRVLIISPWNYPVQLCLNPLIGALAAGNVVTLKPSELAPHSSKAIRDFVLDTFPAELVQVVEGGVEATQELLAADWDHIFFTGSTAVGKVVAQAAAPKLIPTTLELGGKSPCIITRHANLKLAARRIVFGKLINAGQTCVAPDYLLVERKVEDALIEAIKAEIKLRYSAEPLANPQWPKIINERHYHRLTSLIKPSQVIFGGRTDAKQLLIEPTLLKDVKPDDPVMQDEIFGPILPILSFENLNDALSFVQKRERPLAFYIFSEDRHEQQKAFQSCSFGGGCINDTLMHLGNSALPFGGVGKSGQGAYHGKASFDCFTHHKALLKASTRVDMPIRYAPFTKIKDQMTRLFLK